MSATPATSAGPSSCSAPWRPAVESCCWPAATSTAWVAGTAMLGAGEDHREHGTRAQHHPRPVGLDERPGDPFHRMGVGHNVAERAVEEVPQLHPPQVHQHRRMDDDIGYGIMRVTRDQRWAAVDDRQPDLQPAARNAVRVGRRRARGGDVQGPQGREIDGRGPQRPADHRQEGRQAGRQGLHRVSRAGRAATGSTPCGPTRWRT